MRFYWNCLAAARACASRYHCREAARRLGRPCTLLLGKAGAARRRHQLFEATTTAAVAKREPTAAVTPAFGHSPRPSGHNYKNRKAPAWRARRHRVGTGWRGGAGATACCCWWLQTRLWQPCWRTMIQLHLKIILLHLKVIHPKYYKHLKKMLAKAIWAYKNGLVFDSLACTSNKTEILKKSWIFKLI